MSVVRRVIRLLVAFGVILGLLAPASGGSASPADPSRSMDQRVQSLLKDLTPEQRVGQLFLVTYQGRQVGDGTQLNDLIANYHIGGVVLSAANDNFTGPDQTISNASQMIAQIQRTAWDSTRTSTVDTQSGRTVAADYVPLFIGISQEGDGYPNDQILSGLTPLPDEMALGATWNPDLARSVGKVMGSELQSLGINLLLGPSLDVIDREYTASGTDLGTRSFGGNAYWVGEMGKAYVEGLHQGSNGRIAVTAKFFPGLGSSDRLPDDEVITLNRSVDQLKQFDLYPFFQVTGNTAQADTLADALFVTHVRVSGLQRNIRSTTRPISLDPAALKQITDMEPVNTWRQGGGLLVSDDLGSHAIRLLYDPAMKNFDSRQVARDALLAGNDLLYADNFTATGDPDSYTSVTRTLQYFAQLYRSDPAFKQRVDASVARILALKLRLYPSFDLANVTPSQSSLIDLGSEASQQVSYDVAAQAVTLVSPSTQADLDSVLPQPPDRNDRLVFITDTQKVKQCSQCNDQDTLPVDALENSVLKYYGPSTSGQASSKRMSSFSFTDLSNLLNGINTPPADGTPPLEEELRNATWVIFSVRNVRADRQASGALNRLLSQRPDLLQKNQRIIVFSFGAPYYLDGTDLSKVTAYFALYSIAPVFQDVAAKVLFHEQAPQGDLPVSVMRVGYDLKTALSPDPGQVIPLAIDFPALPTETLQPGTATAHPQTFRVGDTIPLRTGIILDQNQRVVPDNTTVQFMFIRNGDNSTIQQAASATVGGVARATYRIDTTGLLEIRVVAPPATSSEILRLNIAQGESAGVTVIAPSPTPTLTPTPTETPEPSPTVSATVTPAGPTRPQLGDWLLAMLIIGFGSSLVYLFGRWWVSIRWGLRWGLCAVLGGLLAYVYLAIGMPGGESWVHDTGRGGIIGMTMVGFLLGWGIGIAWRLWIGQRAGGNLARRAR